MPQQRCFDLKGIFSISLILIIVLLASPALFSQGSISFTPSRPNVEQRVSFTLTPPGDFTGSVEWDFGDGSTVSGGTTISHAYLSAGTFVVKATVMMGGRPKTTQTKIAITENRAISYIPSSPKAGEIVIFQAENFISTQIKWNFGDGTIKTSGPHQTHAYSGPGTFTVTATDLDGRSCCPVTTSVTVAAAAVPSLSYSPPSPKAGEKITFMANNFQSKTLIRWDFGDGTVLDDTTPPAMTHSYATPGSFKVRAYDDGSAKVTATLVINVGGTERTIVFKPADPMANEEVHFDGRHFFSNQIKWDFGDGEIIPQGSTKAMHVYKNPGNYLVQAWDYFGQPSAQALHQALPPVTVRIAITPDLRMISYAPTPALSGVEVTFTATNFRSFSIKWDFGDGTILSSGAPVAKHTYKKEGRYRVSAFDFGGQAAVPLTLPLEVLPLRGPAAPFNISFIQLRFDDGKAYKQVPKNFAPLLSFADIKYEGTGIFEAQWLLDGKPFKSISLALPSARQQTLDSGSTPPLPTQIPGVHDVTLNIVKPEVPFTTPTIRYFVTSEEAQELVSLAITEARDLEKAGLITIEDNRLVLTQGQDYLFKGTITNVSGKVIPSVLVFIILRGKDLDQKKFTNLKPGEKRTFETSFFNETSEQKLLSLEAYETAGRERLLGQGELNISGGGVQLPSPASTPSLSTPIPMPIISGIDPSLVMEDSGVIAPLTISGLNFVREAMSTRVRIRKVSGTSPPGQQDSLVPISVSPTQVQVNVSSGWTSTDQLLEVRVYLQNNAGDLVESNWVLLRVMPKVALVEPPPGIKDKIDILPPKITSVSPTNYIRGVGNLDPLIIEGSNFFHPPLDVWHFQRLVVLLLYPGGTQTIYETGFDGSLDYYPGISPSRIECSASINQSLAHKATSLEVQVRLDVTTYNEATAKHYYSNPVALTCLGTCATIATLSPNRIDAGIGPPRISVFPPDIPMYYGMFDPSCVISVTPKGENEQTLTPTVCENCNKPDQMPRIEFVLPSQLASKTQDLEIKVGNPNISGGRIWSNSLILPVGAITSREDLAQYPDTEIESVSYFLKNTPHKGYLYGRPPYEAEFRAIKKDKDILGFEYAITEGESAPPDDPTNPVYKWLNSSAKSVDFRGEDFYSVELPEQFIGEDEGRWTFWIRAVDVEGRRDPTPAAFLIAIDRIVNFRLIVTKIRVDNDADPPGNPSEVRFLAGASPSVYSEGCSGDSVYIPREFEADQACTHGAGKFKTDPHHVWVMGNADTRSFEFHLNCQNRLPEKIQDREWKLRFWGRECDDGPNYYDEESLGEIIIPFFMTASSEDETPKGYFLIIDGVKHPFNVGDIVPFMKSIEGKDGAFTVWYRFERID